VAAILKKGEKLKEGEFNELVQSCARRQLYTTAARLYQDLLTARPELSGLRLPAARAAALAGCGKGEDAVEADENDRSRLRQQALEWLRADLQMWGTRLDSKSPPVRKSAQGGIEYVKAHPDFGGLRGSAALAKLPEVEREAWRKFWADLDALLQQAREAP
jgi:serine/threonine-protein kinase